MRKDLPLAIKEPQSPDHEDLRLTGGQRQAPPGGFLDREGYDHIDVVNRFLRGENRVRRVARGDRNYFDTHQILRKRTGLP